MSSAYISSFSAVLHRNSSVAVMQSYGFKICTTTILLLCYVHIVTCSSFHSLTFITSRMHWAILLLVMLATEYMVSACHWLVCIPHKAAVCGGIIDTNCVIHCTTYLTLIGQHKVAKD